MNLTGMQIFKYLPAAKKENHSNCKKCGFATCMTFALKLAKKQTSAENCPYMQDELKNLCQKYLKTPQQSLQIANTNIGGESVLYRHEKTFVNPTALTVMLDCNDKNINIELDKIRNYKVSSPNKDLTVDFVILKNFENFDSTKFAGINYIPYKEFNELPLIKIYDNNFTETSNKLIEIRKKAIIDRDENHSMPVCVELNENDNTNELCAKAAFYICKYANMIILPTFNKNLFTTLLKLRQNIFTNPEKPLQVESKIYEFNNPDKNSPVLLTTNFALTFFAVSNELENSNIPAYLVVVPVEGMSVLTAWSAEKFTAGAVAKTIKNLDLINKVSTRKIIIPGLLAHMKDELQTAIPEFEIVIGTIEAYALKDFLKDFH